LKAFGARPEDVLREEERRKWRSNIARRERGGNKSSATSANDDDDAIHDVWRHGFPGCQEPKKEMLMILKSMK
jgi:hypothetical protein